jgi:AcrR family transcriptional regulator
VPRNRQDVDRAEKIEEIVRAGERIVRAGGYEALSFNGIAEELGLARGAVYWYFRSKDELFAACAARAIQTALSKPPQRAGYAALIIWAVDQLAEIRPIHTTLQDRARHSRPAAELLEGIQGTLTAQLRELLRPHVEPARLEPVTGAIFVFVQGLLALPLTPRERQRHLRFLLKELASHSTRQT